MSRTANSKGCERVMRVFSLSLKINLFFLSVVARVLFFLLVFFSQFTAASGLFAYYKECADCLRVIFSLPLEYSTNWISQMGRFFGHIYYFFGEKNIIIRGKRSKEWKKLRLVRLIEHGWCLLSDYNRAKIANKVYLGKLSFVGWFCKSLKKLRIQPR